jgi:toxin YoeB
MYRVTFTEAAKKDLKKLDKKSPQAMAKLEKLIEELQEHPRTGTGQVEQLKHYQVETWSRRLSKEHRLVYRIHEEVVEVLVLSVFGHYADK